MAITRGQLRRRIAGRLGDVQDLTATAAGTTGRIVDTVRLSGAIEQPKNRDIVFTSGTNGGQTRRVTAWDLGLGQIDFAPVGAATAIGDKAELYNFRGRGWRVEEYNDAINQALQDASPIYKVKMGYAPAPFNASTGLIPISNPDLTHISGLFYDAGSGYLNEVPNAVAPLGQGWSYNASTQTLVVRGGSIPGGAALVVNGFKLPTPLTADSDVTNINPEWLTMQACSILCLAAVERDQANYNLGMIFGQQAESQKSSIRTRIPGSTVPVYP